MLLTYFILMLDNVIFLTIIILVISFLSFIGIVSSMEEGKDNKESTKLLKYPLIASIIAVLLYVFTPTTKQAALIFLSGQEDVVATAKNLPKLTKLGTDYLVELLEEGKKDVNNQ